MKTPLGKLTEVDIGAGHIALGGFPALRERGTAPLLLGPCLLWPRSPISLLSSCLIISTITVIMHFDKKVRTDIPTLGRNAYGSVALKTTS